MPKPRSRPPRATPDDRRNSRRASGGVLEPRSLAALVGEFPTIRLRTHTHHPLVYRRMIEHLDPSASPGDLVAVIDRRGELFGFGLANPRSEIVVRMLSVGPQPPGEEFWQDRLDKAVSLRRDLLRLDDVTNAYRVVHAEADGLSGLVVDRYGDTLSAEAFSLGMFQRSAELLQRLAQKCGATHTRVHVDAQVHGQEGFLADPIATPNFPERVTIEEHGTRFRVVFAGGHKTGYFCDQRDNRKKLAELCRDKTVLDLCCYTGGFAVQAKRLGGAREVTAVDLDESALGLAKENADLNQLRIQFVQSDAFGYMRDMLRNGRQYDVVVLDPPKLIRTRGQLEEGTQKHFDLNRLALRLVRPGGLLLTCSCSGLLSEESFLRLLYAAARQAGDSGREVQLLAKTGAAPDHPVAPNCPETEYLRAIWLRVE